MMEIAEILIEILGQNDVEYTELHGGWMIATYHLKNVPNKVLHQGSGTVDVVLRIYDKSQSDRVAKERIVLQFLAEQGFPVPKILLYQKINGIPVMIHEFVKGPLLGELIESGKHTDTIPALLDQYIELMCELHELKVPERYFPNLRGMKYYQQRLNFYEEYVMEEEYTMLIPIIDWLKKRVKQVSFAQFCLIHKDFHPNNIITRDIETKDLVVIDWFDAIVADYREEVGWAYLVAYSYGYQMLAKQIVDTYTKYRETITDLDFFEVLNILRRLTDVLSVIDNNTEAFKVKDSALDNILNQRESELRVHDRLQEITGIRIDRYVELLTKSRP